MRNKAKEFYTVCRQLLTIMNLHEAIKKDIATLEVILHLGALCSSLASNGKRQTTTEKSLSKSALSSLRD